MPNIRKIDRKKLFKLKEQGWSQRKIAKELNCSKSGVHDILALPESGHYPPPDGFFAKATSTLFGEDGKQKLQWVKANLLEKDRYDALVTAMQEVFANTPKVPTIATPEHAYADLMTVYPMGDPHLGMYAWKAETGADFDLAIAEHDLIAAMQRLVLSSPPSEEALIVNVGDFFHSDTVMNKTLKSGHVLDVDTRWAKVLRIGVRAMRSCIELALKRHTNVRVINEIGNHDEHTSQMLTLALAMFYENNTRVSFDESPAKFHYYVFGKNLIGVTHGDTVKPDRLGGIMATDRAEDWGRTVFRVWLTGHVHNRRVFELPGCLVESFRTLAAKDSWTAGSGYRAGRDMHAIVMHKDLGEIERHRVDIAAVE